MNKEEQALKEATDKFYEALNSMFTGDIEPMKKVWSHADDVQYMGPTGGVHIGWPAVLADWSAQADLKLGGKVEPSGYHMQIGSEISVVINEERGQNIGPDGEKLEVYLRATHTFRKEQGEWKMIGDHTDLLSFLQK